MPLLEVGYIRVTHPCATRHHVLLHVLPFDLHVLSLPLAFILSQDQTLHRSFIFLNSLTTCLPSQFTLRKLTDICYKLLNLQYLQRTFFSFFFPPQLFTWCVLRDWECKGTTLFLNCKPYQKKISIITASTLIITLKKIHFF